MSIVKENEIIGCRLITGELFIAKVVSTTDVTMVVSNPTMIHQQKMPEQNGMLTEDDQGNAKEQIGLYFAPMIPYLSSKQEIEIPREKVVFTFVPDDSIMDQFRRMHTHLSIPESPSLSLQG